MEMAAPQSIERQSIGLITPESEQLLYPFQLEGLQVGLEAPNTFFYLNWDTGTGKSRAAAALCQELIGNLQLFDIAIIYTLRLNKINLCNTINDNTSLTARNIEGTKERRTREYRKKDSSVLVMNYEKNHFDLDLLKERIKGQRVLFILDEVQKALHPNLAYKGFNRLRKSVKNSLCWAMSASTSNGNPLRTWRLYSFLEQNPLGTQEQFREEYLAERRLVDFGKGRFTYIDIWNEEKLKEIPARVARWTHIVRKSDPEIRKYFKDTDFVVEPVQLSDHSREIYSILEELAQLDSDKISRVQLFNAMRYCCNTLEGFNHSDNEIAKLIRSYGFVFNSDSSNKFEQIVEKIEQIREQGDKVVIFTQWTHLSLFPLSHVLKRNKIKHVTHYGSGMSSAQAQDAQDSFKQDKSITVFLSSDAGSHGLNFQEARYVIHVEPPHSYDLLTQRSDRIDRIDSYYDNLTSYLFLAKDTVEERVWRVNDYRRRITQNIQGTTESISRPPALDIAEGLHDPRQARWLLTGEVNG